MKRKLPYLFVALAFLALLWQWQGSKQKTEKVAQADELLAHRYQMHGVTMRQFDDSGNLLHRIEAQVAAVGERQTLIELPKLITRNETSVWSISSQQAIATASLTELSLKGQVEVIEHSGPSPLQIRTPQLNYFGKQGRLSSAHEVVIEDGDLTLSGMGFEVDLTHQDYQILSDVRGSHRQ